jgi:hypothetical protein
MLRVLMVAIFKMFYEHYFNAPTLLRTAP